MYGVTHLNYFGTVLIAIDEVFLLVVYIVDDIVILF